MLFQNVASSLLNFYANNKQTDNGSKASTIFNGLESKHDKTGLTGNDVTKTDSGNDKKPMRYVFLLGILPMVKKYF
jgi:hypothetical protein